VGLKDTLSKSHVEIMIKGKSYLLWGGVGLAALILIFLGVYFRQTQVRNRERRRLMEEMARMRNDLSGQLKGAACEIEFPYGSEPTQFHYFKGWSDSFQGSRTGVQAPLPRIFLTTDCLPGQLVPLKYAAGDGVPELLIARRTQDSQRRNDAMYLWVLGNQFVSRAVNSPGHARIYQEAGERYAIEDLNSQNGTLINGREIKHQGPRLLQDQDVIEIGGPQGIRLVYREASGFSLDDETMMLS